MAVFPLETENVNGNPVSSLQFPRMTHNSLEMMALEQGSQQVGQPQWPQSHCPFLCNSCHQAFCPEAKRHLKLQRDQVRYAQP